MNQRQVQTASFPTVDEIIMAQTLANCTCFTNRVTTPRRKFTEVDDQKLREAVARYGPLSWNSVAQSIGFSARQCRDRWNNYLNPTLRLDAWTDEEDSLLLTKYAEIGPHWRQLTEYFPDRSVNSVRNRYVKLSQLIPIQPDPHPVDFVFENTKITHLVPFRSGPLN